MGIGVIGRNLLGTWEKFGYCVDGVGFGFLARSGFRVCKVGFVFIEQ